MSDDGSLQVDTDAVRAHAQQVAGLAQGLGEAVQAGTHSAMDTQAFGVLCAFLVPPVVALQAVGIVALTTAAATLAGVDVGLRGVANGYDAIDSSVNGQLTELLARLS